MACVLLLCVWRNVGFLRAFFAKFNGDSIGSFTSAALLRGCSSLCSVFTTFGWYILLVEVDGWDASGSQEFVPQTFPLQLPFVVIHPCMALSKFLPPLFSSHPQK